MILSWIDSIVPILLVASITATGEGPDLWIDDPMLGREKGALLHAGRPFSGRQIERSGGGDLLAIVPYDQGVPHGYSVSWYPDGSPQEVRGYEHGKKEGIHLGWWQGGEQRFLYRFRQDRHEGSSCEWYPDGTLARQGHHVGGREEGRQILYDSAGVIRANYVVREGRRFGSIGAKPCRPE